MKIIRGLECLYEERLKELELFTPKKIRPCKIVLTKKTEKDILAGPVIMGLN